MSSVDKKLIERVRRLLAMAADVASPHEAAIAARRAAVLMAEYNLDHASIMLHDGIEDRITEQRVDREFGRAPRWYSLLSVPVAKLYDCESRDQFNAETLRYYTEFVGVDNDVLVATYVHDYLVSEIERLAKRYRASTGSDRRAMNDFRLGASVEITRMLKDMAADRHDEADLSGSDSADETEKHTAANQLSVLKSNLIREKYNIAYESVTYRFRRSASYERGREEGAKVSIRAGVKASARAKIGRIR
ncbi:conserved hypothetical protein [gamma proteobacterium NOR5-3]|nr:conserved hypothetical protein [gamma proteobacterium NOR5-3]